MTKKVVMVTIAKAFLLTLMQEMKEQCDEKRCLLVIGFVLLSILPVEVTAFSHWLRSTGAYMKTCERNRERKVDQELLRERFSPSSNSRKLMNNLMLRRPCLYSG